MANTIAVRAVIIDDQHRLFCVHHTAYDDLPQPAYWCTPGGGIDPGEPFQEALKREITEELGVVPTIGDLLFVQQFHDKARNREQIELFFHVTNWPDFLDINLSKTTHGTEEIAEFGFINPKDRVVLPRFLQEIDLSRLKPSGNVTKLYSY